MLLGIGIKGVNILNSKKYNIFLFEFIPHFFYVYFIWLFNIYDFL